MEKTCFILAYLTSQGRIPLLALNDIITGVLHGWPSRKISWLLCQTFYQCRLVTNPNTGLAKRFIFYSHVGIILKSKDLGLLLPGQSDDSLGSTKTS